MDIYPVELSSGKKIGLVENLHTIQIPWTSPRTKRFNSRQKYNPTKDSIHAYGKVPLRDNEVSPHTINGNETASTILYLRNIDKNLINIFVDTNIYEDAGDNNDIEDGIVTSTKGISSTRHIDINKTNDLGKMFKK